jgi:hypothetical protein
MKEKLIKLWERKERYIINETQLENRRILFSQAFGALEMALEMLDNWDGEDELIALWNDEWKARLEEKVYEVR